MIHSSVLVERVVAFAARHKAAVTVVGGLVGSAVGIYSDEARAVLAWTWSHVIAGGTLVILAVTAIFTVAWWTRGIAERRRELRREVVRNFFDIHADDFEEDLPSDDAVIGRQLWYLEGGAESPDLVVLLHGLGLDADDFRPFMNVARQHTVAITLFGHNADEARDARYRPIGMALHADLISGAINNLQRQYPYKRLTLVGFSVGCDLLFRLAELWRDHPERQPKIRSVLLLDPNINHSTMVISSKVARLNPEQPLAELKRIAQIPEELVEFQNVCEYLHKISGKDLSQVQRYAADLWDYWEPDGHYDLFFRRLERIRAVSDLTRVFFSMHFEQRFNDVVARARQRGIRQVFDLRRVDHFEFCEDAFLKREIGALLRGR
ncbi:alpha/beta fold hydrolase [Streptomyces actinomycinicus]|uniref:Alpha/beta fold hydrolase n=1 Tax=Streptomyces actinomycinicus TaxID=1695166 RepID=A0A937JQX6_9ACTN|nr:alpha/beta fold hydrolase [Streptomyces actinomycinicus]MBL1083908.1 alpha/beta fold hydrolase [Streptomyces actinomycinicus]